MPFDVRDFPGAGAKDRADRRLIAGWLFGVCGMILGMIALGGATRLTGSGLSIMEWAPFQGALPPWSEAEWRRLFGLYKGIPQYTLLHEGFGLDGFKRIFWLEWVHRLWGRLIGLAVILPLIGFWWTGRIEPWLRWRLLGIFVLGGLQGAVGWFMVASGFFADATAVSPYRLVVHLVLAVALFAAILWTGLTVLHPHGRAGPGSRPLRLAVAAVSALVALTLLAGGFVAGTHAGLDYNTFPLMAGRLFPAGYGALRPYPLNWTENIAAVQFDHRALATLTLLATLLTAFVGFRSTTAGEVPGLRRALLWLGGALAAQYALGVATLLSVVARPLAVSHQIVAVLALTAALRALHCLRPIGRRAPTGSP